MESPLFLGLGSDRSVSIFVQALMVVSMTTPQCGVLHWWQGGLVVHQHPSLSVTPKKCHHLHIVNTSLSIDFLSLHHTHTHTLFYIYWVYKKWKYMLYRLDYRRKTVLFRLFFIIKQKIYSRVLPLHIWCHESAKSSL